MLPRERLRHPPGPPEAPFLLLRRKPAPSADAHLPQPLARGQKASDPSHRRTTTKGPPRPRLAASAPAPRPLQEPRPLRPQPKPGVETVRWAPRPVREPWDREEGSPGAQLLPSPSTTSFSGQDQRRQQGHQQRHERGVRWASGGCRFATEGSGSWLAGHARCVRLRAQGGHVVCPSRSQAALRRRSAMPGWEAAFLTPVCLCTEHLLCARLCTQTWTLTCLHSCGRKRCSP